MQQQLIYHTLGKTPVTRSLLIDPLWFPPLQAPPSSDKPRELQGFKYFLRPDLVKELPFITGCWLHLYLEQVHLGQDPWTKFALYLFNGYGGKSRDHFVTHEIQTSMSINKILLENSHTHLFTYLLWLLSHYNSGAEYLQHRPYCPQRWKYLLSGLLQKIFDKPCFIIITA